MSKQQSGSVLIISALMLPLMLGCLGFAYDFGNLYMHKSRLQNIADAAALAGGRAYLESKKKPEGRDTYDVMPGLIGADEHTYKVGMTVDDINRSFSNHWDADNAADDYILKNIANLGSSVISDQYSHYALRSLGAGFTQSSNEGSTATDEELSRIGSPKIFYRIGLYEEVPLYFLPALIGKKQQRVRAGAVVLVDDGKGVTPGKSVFDNLFTIRDRIESDNIAVDLQDQNEKPSNNGAKIQATFDGSIVFANGAWNPLNAAENFYTEEEKNYQLTAGDGLGLSIEEMKKIPNMGGKAVWWNTSNGLEGIESNISGFLNKLGRPHVELKKNCAGTKDTDSLKNLNTQAFSRYRKADTNKSFHYTITDSRNVVTHYFHAEKNYEKENNKLVFCIPRSEEVCHGTAYILEPGVTEETYYSFFTEGYQFKNITTGNPVTCNTYVLDSKSNNSEGDNSERYKIFSNKKSATGMDFYQEKFNPVSGQYEYRQINKTNNPSHPDLNLLTNKTENTSDFIRYYYTDVGIERNFTIYKKRDIVFLNDTRRVNEPQIIYSNVFHWEWEKDGEISLTVDGGLTGDTPLYVILTGCEGSPIKINVTQSNEQPLIFCNLTKNDISEFTIAAGVTFKGTIYSPFAKVVNLPTGGTGGSHFIGNIIATELDIRDPGVTWTQKNHVVNDSDLNTVPEEVAEKQEERKQQAITLAKNELKSFSPVWDNPDWFSTLPTEPINQKEKFQEAWNAARKKLLETYGLDMPDWPWKEGGKETDPNQHHYSLSDNVGKSTGERLRIINFRTEYTIEPYIDPFTDLYLSDE